MSQHHAIASTDRGSIEAVVSSAGIFFDVWDGQGNYLGWAPTEAKARAMIEAQ
ncbi:hypothetical protein ACQ4N7_28385 [Nodosilinea sp. AN01ver1]|uniref:hypothetical protein n=1 Tax=Nodosilinea sp. AN01ver1 TaxID=3423362 RepID=UPI003D31C0FB